MTFVRVKNIKGQKYAYLVENTWSPRGSRQKVLNYLGKIHCFGDTGFATLEAKPFKECIVNALQQMLASAGFTETNGRLSKEELTVDLNEKKVLGGKSPIALKFNQGFICDHTLRELLDFKPEEEYNATVKKLASSIVAAGLNLKPEDFAQLFETVKPKEEAKEEFYY